MLYVAAQLTDIRPLSGYAFTRHYGTVFKSLHATCILSIINLCMHKRRILSTHGITKAGSLGTQSSKMLKTMPNFKQMSTHRLKVRLLVTYLAESQPMCIYVAKKQLLHPLNYAIRLLHTTWLLFTSVVF